MNLVLNLATNPILSRQVKGRKTGQILLMSGKYLSALSIHKPTPDKTLAWSIRIIFNGNYRQYSKKLSD